MFNQKIVYKMFVCFSLLLAVSGCSNENENTTLPVIDEELSSDSNDEEFNVDLDADKRPAQQITQKQQKTEELPLADIDAKALLDKRSRLEAMEFPAGKNTENSVELDSRSFEEVTRMDEKSQSLDYSMQGYGVQPAEVGELSREKNQKIFESIENSVDD